MSNKISFILDKPNSTTKTLVLLKYEDQKVY